MSPRWSWPRRHPSLTAALFLFTSVLGYAIYLFQPHGYGNLERLEKVANRCTSPGASTVDVSTCFQSAGIAFTVLPKANQEDHLFSDGRVNLTAHKGDTPMVASTHSGANGPFPCSGRVDLQIVLVFGPDERLRDRLVKRFYTCP
jgi:hypothetical protein